MRVFFRPGIPETGVTRPVFEGNLICVFLPEYIYAETALVLHLFTAQGTKRDNQIYCGEITAKDNQLLQETTYNFNANTVEALILPSSQNHLSVLRLRFP